MSTSDFIVVISIIFTLIAIVISNNKQLWIYKFSKLEIFFFLFYVVAVNILILGNYKIPIDNIEGCCYNGCCENIVIKSETIAYVITIILIGVLIWYVGWCNRFPSSNYDKIIRYYKGLIQSDIALLMSDLQNYHQRDIEKYIERINKSAGANNGFELASVTEEKIAKANRKALKRQSLTIQVMTEVIMDKQFIQKSIGVNPIFCLDLFSQIETNNYNEDCIEYYFTKLIQSRSESFFNELLIDFSDTATTFEEKINSSQFLKLIFDKKCTATLFRTNYLYGEAALKEIHSGCEIFGRKQSEWLENDYKKTICYQFIKYWVCSFMYIHQDFMDDKNDRPYKDTYPEYLNHLTYDMIDVYGKFGDNTYAHIFTADVSKMIKDAIDFLKKKGDLSKLSTLINKRLTITYKTCSNSKMDYSIESVKEAFEEYISLNSDINSDNSEICRIYLKYLKDNFVSHKQLYKDALHLVFDRMKEKSAYNELVNFINPKQ